MSFDMDVTGVAEVAGAFGRSAATIRPRVEKVRDKTKGAIKDSAQANAPVDDGELRDSIHETEEGVEATADHAPFMEWGTYKDAPQPYMDPAVDEHEGSFADGVAKEGADI